MAEGGRLKNGLRALGLRLKDSRNYLPCFLYPFPFRFILGGVHLPPCIPPLSLPPPFVKEGWGGFYLPPEISGEKGRLGSNQSDFSHLISSL